MNISLEFSLSDCMDKRENERLFIEILILKFLGYQICLEYILEITCPPLVFTILPLIV